MGIAQEANESVDRVTVMGMRRMPHFDEGLKVCRDAA
jgi:hypothetical protein